MAEQTDSANVGRTPTDIANEIAAATDADVFFYSGPVARGLDYVLIDACSRRQFRRNNLLMILVTEGGDPDAAFRIARCLQEKYKKYTVFVTGRCKSAGTLIALGATDLIVADYGEMGPLDVQLSRKDELFEFQSGLTVISALGTLREEALAAFENFMLTIKLKSDSAITTHTAMEIASTMAVGLFSRVYAQVDPMHIGEAGRANKVAKQYGEMLIGYSQNSSVQSLNRLINGYSSHGFVIDRKEATILFARVREPNARETELASCLGKLALWPSLPNDPTITFLSAEKQKAAPAAGDSDVGVPRKAPTVAPDVAGPVVPEADTAGGAQ